MISRTNTHFYTQGALQVRQVNGRQAQGTGNGLSVASQYGGSEKGGHHLPQASVSVSRQTSSCVLHRVGKLRPLLVSQDSESLRKLVPMETFYMEEGDKNILRPMADLRYQAF